MNELEIGVQVKLNNPEDFLLIKESLTRIGVASRKTKTLFQTAHILHKRGLYYICHFKELFTLDGKPSTLSEEDVSRRDLISILLNDWGLLTVIEFDKIDENKAPIQSVKILSFKDKQEWNLESKYSLGNKK